MSGEHRLLIPTSASQRFAAARGVEAITLADTSTRHVRGIFLVRGALLCAAQRCVCNRVYCLPTASRLLARRFTAMHAVLSVHAQHSRRGVWRMARMGTNAECHCTALFREQKHRLVCACRSYKPSRSHADSSILDETLHDVRVHSLRKPLLLHTNAAQCPVRDAVCDQRLQSGRLHMRPRLAKTVHTDACCSGRAIQHTRLAVLVIRLLLDAGVSDGVGVVQRHCSRWSTRLVSHCFFASFVSGHKWLPSILSSSNEPVVNARQPPTMTSVIF